MGLIKAGILFICSMSCDTALPNLNRERKRWTPSEKSPWLFFRTALFCLIAAFKLAPSPSAAETDTSNN